MHDSPLSELYAADKNNSYHRGQAVGARGRSHKPHTRQWRGIPCPYPQARLFRARHQGFARQHTEQALAEVVAPRPPRSRPGVHLNSRNPQAPAGFAGTVSRSCHSLEESRGAADYVFISPVFDSISKAGYTAAFSLDELRGKVDSRCIALGGVEPCRLSQVADAGFGGAALLGYIWRDFSISELDKRINTLKTICSSL